MDSDNSFMKQSFYPECPVPIAIGIEGSGGSYCKATHFLKILQYLIEEILCTNAAPAMLIIDKISVTGK